MNAAQNGRTCPTSTKKRSYFVALNQLLSGLLVEQKGWP
jgi:hypothetical protein